MAHRAAIDDVETDVPVRKIDLNDLKIALAQGWEDFLAKRGDLIFIGLIYTAATLLAGLYAYQMSLLPLIFPMAAGAILFGPAVASGFYELARRRERGMDARWRHFLDFMRSPGKFSLLSLASVLVLLFVIWLYVAWAIYTMTVGTLDPAAVGTVGDFLNAVFTTPEGWRMIVIGNIVGLGFAIVTLMISVVSFPMLVDKNVSWATALRTSVRVATRNPVTVGIWGLIVVALLVLGALPALVGLAVVFPLLGYATWHLYTRAVER